MSAHHPGWTSHGHRIPGTTTTGTRPSTVARCGGPSICPQCAAEAGLLHGAYKR